jgi:hypothetical membrane protein
MVTKQKSVAPFAFVGILSGVLAPIMFVIAIFADGSWTFNVDMLSALGISNVAIAASLFKWTCVVAGITLLFFGAGKAYIRMTGLDAVSGLFLAVSGVFLVGVGLVTLDNANIHHFFAALHFAMILIAMVAGTVGDWQKGRLITASVGACALVIFLCSTVGLTMAGAEVVLVFCFCVWTVVQSLSLAFSKN